MKVNYSHIFFFFTLTLLGFLAATPAAAQEDPTVNEFKDLNQNPDPIMNEDKSVFSEHDHTFKFRDSTHVRSAVATMQKGKSNDQAKPSSNKEEDALSFNFLYYIIQKFKISDLVDDSPF
jgi:hypothetical protein